MRYLLDTHILLWALQNNPKLTSAARNIIIDPNNTLFFSVASIWEIAIKVGQGYVKDLIEPKLFYQTLVANDYTELPIHSDHAAKVMQLPMIHKDPFDRMIIAQSLIEDLVVITADSKVAKYDISVIEI